MFNTIAQVNNNFVDVFFTIVSFLYPACDFVNDRTQPCINYSRNNFVVTRQKRNRPPIFDLLRITFFRYKADASCSKSFRQFTFAEAAGGIIV